MAGEADESGGFRPMPREAPRRSSGRVWVIGIVLATLLAGGGYFALNRPGRAQPATSPGPRAVPVVTVPARTGDLPVYLTGLAPAPPLNTLTVRSRAARHPMRTPLQEGQTSKTPPALP